VEDESPLTLILTYTDGRSQVALWTRGDIAIGRSSDNDVQVDDKRVSSRHGRLSRGQGGLLYEDLGSTNGSGLAVAGGEAEISSFRAGEPCPVGVDDVILLGDARSPVRLCIKRGIDPAIAFRQPAANPAFDALPLRVLNPVVQLFRTFVSLETPEELAYAAAKAALELCPAAAMATVAYRLATQGDGAESWRFAGYRRDLPRRMDGEQISQLVGPDILHRTGREGALYYPAAGLVQDIAARSRRAPGVGVAVPILGHLGSLGALILGTEVGRQVGQVDVDIVQMIAMQLGLHLETASLHLHLEDRERRLAAENRYLRHVVQGDTDLVCASSTMQEVASRVAELAAADTPLLLLGEGGTGKECVARAIHHRGSRADALFVPVSCAGFTEAQLDQDLFGVARPLGVDAPRPRKALVQLASEGTLFLDEVDALPRSLQHRLLRLVREHSFQPLGADAPLSIDVRIIAACHRDLASIVRERGFREDLFRELSHAVLALPPLRDRKDGIPQLARHLVAAFSRQLGRKAPAIGRPALKLLTEHPWPGNVRQLRIEIERAVLHCPIGGVLEPIHFSESVRGSGTSPFAGGTLSAALGQAEAGILRHALAANAWRRSKTAEALGVSRQTLLDKMKRHGIRAPRKGSR